MSLKSIRQSYSKFLSTLNDAGVKLNESQKANLDGFILAIESKMSKQKEHAIRATKKVVTEHLESEYKKVFESIMKHQQQNAELAAKIQNKITSLNESKKMARKVDNYLECYLETMLPKKTIVDYDRMQKLENLHESLKDLLVCNEDAVENKKHQLSRSFNRQKKELETQLAKLQVKLNESMNKNLSLNRKIDSFKALELLESKTADLPDYEARQLKKRFANATTDEIKHKFNSVLESIKDEMKVEEKEEVSNIEEEVKDIIESDDVKENDMLKGRNHNGHINEAEGQYPEATQMITDWLENNDGYSDDSDFFADLYRELTTDELDKNSRFSSQDKTLQDAAAEIEEWYRNGANEDDSNQVALGVYSILNGKEYNEAESDDFETLEKVKENDDGEVELNDAEKVDESLMTQYCKDFKRFF